MLARRPVKVMVTGVGAIIGQGIVRSLRMLKNIYIIGLDRSPDAYGRHTCDSFFSKPDLCESDARYAEFLLDIFDRERIDLVMPGIEQDVFYFDCNRALFENIPTQFVLNDSRLIGLSRDKWLMHQALIASGLRAIPTSTDTAWDACMEKIGPAPVLFKPRMGSGGRDHSVVEDKYDFQYLLRKHHHNFLLQKLVGTPEEEYTVGLFGYGDGECGDLAVLKRKLGPGGATWTAETVSFDAELERVCRELCAIFRPVGPTNFQFRKSDGKAWLLEINPRFSSSVSLRAALGFNEASMSIEFFLQKRRPGTFPWKKARCVRYIEDHIEYL